MATASSAHPWLAIEGDTVSVQLARAHVLATAVGPAVPEEGHFPVPPATRCTFTFTLARASGTVSLSAAAFTIVDEFGHLLHPRVTAQGGGPAYPHHARPDRDAHDERLAANRLRLAALDSRRSQAHRLLGLRRRDRLTVSTRNRSALRPGRDCPSGIYRLSSINDG